MFLIACYRGFIRAHRVETSGRQIHQRLFFTADPREAMSFPTVREAHTFFWKKSCPELSLGAIDALPSHSKYAMILSSDVGEMMQPEKDDNNVINISPAKAQIAALETALTSDVDPEAA